MIDIQSIITFVLGIIATSIGAYLNHLFRKQEMKTEYLLTRKAVQALFISCIKNFIDYLASNDYLYRKEWNNTFWNDNQLFIAKYFPEECVVFSSLISKIVFTEDFHKDKFRTDFYRRNAQQLLCKVEKLK